MTRTLLLLISSVFSSLVFSQVKLAEVDVSSESNKSTSVSELIIDGKYIPRPVAAPLSNPFFKSQTWTKIDIKYKGNWLTYPQALFDLENNNVLIGVLENNEYVPILINQSAIEEFIFHGFYFKNLGNFSNIPNRFHEVIWEGEKVSMYKDYQKKIAVEGGISVYEESVKTYLIKEGNVYLYKNRRDLFRLFPEEKRLIKKHVRNYSLSYSTKKPVSLSKVIEFCNTL